MTHMPRLGRMVVGYFALTGLALHLAFGVFWLLRPDLVLEARRFAASQHLWLGAVGSPPSESPAKLALEDVRSLVPAWQPLPASASAPAPGSVRIGNLVYRSIREAVSALKADDTLNIGPGVYETSMVIQGDNIRVQGHGHVVLQRAAAEGKAAIVVRGNDVKVSNLECRYIEVPDGNGACIRQEGKNLFIEHLYVNDTQMGLLTVREPGLIYIRDSRFELTYSINAWAHSIYIGGGKLLAEDSQLLAAQHQGHEIKSRAETTTIIRCIVASLDAVDSRLIDVPDDGTLTVEDSLLAQGRNSSNGDAIALGMEKRYWPKDRVTLRNNRPRS